MSYEDVYIYLQYLINATSFHPPSINGCVHTQALKEKVISLSFALGPLLILTNFYVLSHGKMFHSGRCSWHLMDSQTVVHCCTVTFSLYSPITVHKEFHFCVLGGAAHWSHPGWRDSMQEHLSCEWVKPFHYDMGTISEWQRWDKKSCETSRHGLSRKWGDNLLHYNHLQFCALHCLQVWVGLCQSQFLPLVQLKSGFVQVLPNQIGKKTDLCRAAPVHYRVKIGVVSQQTWAVLGDFEASVRITWIYVILYMLCEFGLCVCRGEYTESFNLLGSWVIIDLPYVCFQQVYGRSSCLMFQYHMIMCRCWY